MYQAQARQLLNQKDTEIDSYMQDTAPDKASQAPQERPQSPIDGAVDRLEQAFVRLERNLQHVTVGQERSVQQEQQLMQAVRERDELQATIATMEEQYAELQKAASTVYDKLDASIDRINQIIES